MRCLQGVLLGVKVYCSFSNYAYAHVILLLQDATADSSRSGLGIRMVDSAGVLLAVLA